MLAPQLNNCTECTTISNLLYEIDCKLTEIAKNQYNNIIFELNKKIPFTVISDLINYKMILTYKMYNPEYAGCYSLECIISKIKLLTNK